MEITPVQYPAFLPCPTWQFSDNRDTFESRTGFESGWTRQRKKFWTNYRTGSLSFYMDTPTYARWTEWVNANGYDWFFIELDQIGGDKFEQVILRFIGPVQFNYDAYDRVRLTVPAEEYSGLPDPAKPVPQDLSGLPECQPYSCSAYEDYLNETGLIRGLSYSVIPGNDPPFPFATSTADTGKLFCYTNRTGASSLVTQYNGTAGVNSGPTIAISNKDITGLGKKPPDFCGGDLDTFACIDFEGATFDTDISRGPNNDDANAVAEWGDHWFDAIVTGYNGGQNLSDGSGTSGSVVNGAGKKWRYTYNGNTSTAYSSGLVAVGISQSTNNVTIQIRMKKSTSGSEPTISTDMTINDNSNKFNQLSVSVESTSPFVDQRESDGLYGVFRNVTVTAFFAGQSISQTTRQQMPTGGFTANPEPLTNIEALPLTRFEQPTYLNSCVLSFTHISCGIYTADVQGSSKIAFDRNFADYTPPEYCNG